MTEFQVPANVRSIGQGVFRGCSALTSVTFPADSRLESIGQSAFMDTAITEFYMPDTVVAVNSGCFQGIRLKTLKLSKKLASIGNGAQLCSGAETIIVPEGNQYFKTIDGVQPALWLKNQKSSLGIEENDFEHFTLSDKAGVNAHLSKNGDFIVSGRDLEPEMVIRYVKPEEVYESVYSFYNDDENVIVFGCAGLKAITGEITPVKSLGLYLYGEICMAEGQAVFGNLMLSKLRLNKVK
jgi:hypothetical protein